MKESPFESGQGDAVIDAGETKTKLVKTCRNTFNRNKDKVWLESYWKVITPSK